MIDRIVGETAGYPYFLQFFGAFACSRIGLVHIESSDFERVEGALLHELDLAFFEDRFLTASPAEQQLLGALAALGSRVSVRQLRGRVDSVGNVDELLRRLVDRGLLYRPTRGSYEFALPLFGAYLRRHAKLTQLTPAVSSGRAADR